MVSSASTATVAAQRLQPTPVNSARGWVLPASTVLPFALLVALVISTQFLFQPFVWRNWPVDEVLLGWLDILRDRAITALAIGLMLMAAGRIAVRSASARMGLSLAAIAIGAVAGEMCVALLAGRGALQDMHLAVGRVLQWTVVGGSIAAMVYLWRGSAQVRADMQAAELRRSQIERQMAQLRLQSLRSRIEPHFLFNTLATVRRLHQTDPVQGARLLDQFLSYLRMTLESEDAGRGTLGQEIDLVTAYLNVAAMRMSGRLTLHWDVPDELRACDLPPLTIATLIENAVKHGIAPQPEGGSIEVRARALGVWLEVSVADTGVGFDTSGSGGTGIGLANIRARLATLYGAEAALELQNNMPRGAIARMRLPRRVKGVAR